MYHAVIRRCRELFSPLHLHLIPAEEICIMLPSSCSDDGPSHLGLFQVPMDMDAIQSSIGLHSHTCFEPSNPHTFSSSVPPNPGPFMTLSSILDPATLSNLDNLVVVLGHEAIEPPISSSSQAALPLDPPSEDEMCRVLRGSS